MINKELNRILHQPIRTQIMAFLVVRQFGDYTMLKKTFHLSDGHMTTHMRELIAHGYVIIEKKFIKNKPCTTYTVTKYGKEAFQEYVCILRDIINAENFE